MRWPVVLLLLAGALPCALPGPAGTAPLPPLPTALHVTPAGSVEPLVPPSRGLLSNSTDAGGGTCGGNGTSAGLTWLGASINLVGSVCSNGGVNLMKLGHTLRHNSAPKEADRTPVHKFRQWQIGITTFISGTVLNFISFAFAPQALLAALGSVQFVANVFFAVLLNGEKATVPTYVGTALIVAGNVVMVSSGPGSQCKVDAGDLKANFVEPVYLAYVSCMAATCAGAYSLYKAGRRRAEECLERDEKLSTLWRLSMPYSYALYSGMVGTNSVLFSKILSTLLVGAFSDPMVFADWLPPIALVGFIFCAVFWVKQGNAGLAMFDALVIVPTLQIVWVTFGIFTGLFFFQEYKELQKPKEMAGGEVGESGRAALFSLGLLMVLGGALMLAPDSEAEEKVVEEEMVEEKKLGIAVDDRELGALMMDDQGSLLQQDNGRHPSYPIKKSVRRQSLQNVGIALKANRGSQLGGIVEGREHDDNDDDEAAIRPPELRQRHGSGSNDNFGERRSVRGPSVLRRASQTVGALLMDSGASKQGKYHVVNNRKSSTLLTMLGAMPLGAVVDDEYDEEDEGSVTQESENPLFDEASFNKFNPPQQSSTAHANPMNAQARPVTSNPLAFAAMQAPPPAPAAQNPLEPPPLPSSDEDDSDEDGA